MDSSTRRIFRTRSNRPRPRAQYDDLTAEALGLFERGEDVVAFWTAVEFYAGWADPFVGAAEEGIPRRKPEYGRLIEASGVYQPFELAHPEELVEWADSPWPLARGSRRAPRFGTAGTPGDASCHRIVHPNSDSNGDMLLPWVMYLPDADAFGPVSRSELRRLHQRYPGGGAEGGAENGLDPAASADERF